MLIPGYVRMDVSPVLPKAHFLTLSPVQRDNKTQCNVSLHIRLTKELPKYIQAAWKVSAEIPLNHMVRLEQLLKKASSSGSKDIPSIYSVGKVSNTALNLAPRTSSSVHLSIVAARSLLISRKQRRTRWTQVRLPNVLLLRISLEEQEKTDKLSILPIMLIAHHPERRLMPTQIENLESRSANTQKFKVRYSSLFSLL